MTKELTDPLYVIAKTRLVEAQIDGQLSDNRLADALADTAGIAAERESLKNKWELAGAAYHRIYYLTGEIGEKSMGSMIDTLSRWDRMDDGLPDREYRLVICSPGGDVVHGFQAYSFLKGLAERRTLTITAAGLCASMATILHQAASEGRRVIEPGCSYLIHEVSGGVGGRSDAIKDTAEWMQTLNQTMREIFAERSHIEAEEFEARINRRETFLTPEQVLEWGLADEIRYVT